jgi:hypothetical protein
MNDPRYIFSWQIHPEPEIKVGDRVKVIASQELLSIIGIVYTNVLGIYTYVTEIDDQAIWRESLGYKGSVDTSPYSYPLSHWQDFLEVIEPTQTASLKFGWMRRDNDIPEEFNTSLYPN